MPYLLEVLRAPDEIASIAMKPPFGPGFDEDVLPRVAKVEVWATTASDEDEWVEWRVFFDSGDVEWRRVNGY